MTGRIRRIRTVRFDRIEDGNRCGNNQRLAHLQAIDAGKDVDGIRAEHRQRCHIHVVQAADVDAERASQPRAHKVRQHDGGRVEVHIVHHQQRQRRNRRQQEFVAPAQVEDVIGKAEQHHAADRQ